MNASMSPPPLQVSDPSPSQTHHTWPTVIGVIGIILASLGILGSIFGLLGGGNLIANLLPEEQRQQLLQKLSMSDGVNLAREIISLVLNLLLLWGSINLVKRRQCRGLLNTWAILTCIFVVVSIVVMLSKINSENEMHLAKDMAGERTAADVAENSGEDQRQQMEDDRRAAQDKADEIRSRAQMIGGTIGGVCGGAFGFAWPIIVLCFMNGRRKQETMASWGT